MAQNQIQPPSTQPCLYKQGYCFAAIAATVERYTPLSARVSIAEALFPSGQVTSHALVIGHQPIRISSTVSVPLFPGESSMHGRSLYRNGMATCNDPNRRFLRRWLDNSDGWDKGRCGKSRIFPSLAFLFFFFSLIQPTVFKSNREPRKKFEFRGRKIRGEGFEVVRKNEAGS